MTRCMSLFQSLDHYTIRLKMEMRLHLPSQSRFKLGLLVIAIHLSFMAQYLRHLYRSNPAGFGYNTNSTRNSFYGTSYKSQIATTTRDFPSAIKSFSFIAIEGNIPPSFIHMRTTGKYMDRTSSGQIPANPTYSDFIQSSDLSDSEFVQKEGHYYAPILRDRLEPAPSSYNATTYSTNSLTEQRKLVNQFLLFMLEFDTTSKID